MTLKAVQNALVNSVGITISIGDALPIATRTPIIDVGKICREEALSTKNIAEEYSAFFVLSKSRADCTP